MLRPTRCVIAKGNGEAKRFGRFTPDSGRDSKARRVDPLTGPKIFREALYAALDF
jgi:hypothetical protein